jgi:hypothetical protein
MSNFEAESKLLNYRSRTTMIGKGATLERTRFRLNGFQENSVNKRPIRT